MLPPAKRPAAGAADAAAFDDPRALTSRERDVRLACNYLSIEPEQIASAPQITPQLQMIVKTLRREGQPKKSRKLISQSEDEGTRSTIISTTQPQLPYGPGADLLISWPKYLSSSDHEDARKVLECFRAVPHGVRFRSRDPRLHVLPVEAYCVAAKVHPHSILAILTGEVVRLGAQASSIVASVNQPRVVQKLVDRAMDDEEDTRMEAATLLSKATGFLPTPRGSQTTVNVAANSSSNASAQAASLPAPAPEQTIRRLVDRFNEARGLPPAAPVIVAIPKREMIEAEAMEVDEDCEAPADEAPADEDSA